MVFNKVKSAEITRQKNKRKSRERTVEKYKLVSLLLITLFLGWLYFPKEDALPKPESILEIKPIGQVDGQVKSAITAPSYLYQNIYEKLQSEGIVLTPIKNHEIISQIFPKSKIWKFVTEKRNTFYLADGPDKTESNAVNGQVLTDKTIDFNTLQTDFGDDKEEELIAFTIINFKDVALCCNEKRFLNFFKKNKEGKWVTLKEKELEVYYGGKHTGKITTVTLGEFSVIEVIIEGYYFNGLKISTVEWYLWQEEDFKQIWRAHLFYNTDTVGTFPKEAMDNYQAEFEMEEKGEEDYPRIKLVITYTKRNGQNLSIPEEEIISYVWDRERLVFEKTKITSTF